MLRYLTALLLIAALFPVIEAGILLRRVQRAVPVVMADVSASTNGASDTLARVNSVIVEVHNAAQKEAAYYDPAVPGGPTQQITRLIVDAKSLVGRTDISLNGMGEHPGVLQNLSVAISASAGLTQRAASDLDDTTASVRPILSNLARSSDALATGLPPILSNLQSTSAQTVVISQNTADTTRNIDLTTHDIQQFVHRETTPIRGTFNVIKGFIKDFGGAASGGVTAYRTH
jgi:hypothetical protein